MGEIVLVTTTVVSVGFGLLGILALIRNYVINSIGELKFMLREAKKRQEIAYTEAEAENIKRLEKQIENHWGRKLVREKDWSIFDIM